MLGEMSRGKAALGADTAALIGANAGGPYGPAVLRRIEAESNAVWEQINRGEETKAGKQAGKGWLRARVRINARDDEPWTACAMPSQGVGDAFSFGPPA